jgi:hypothetical protein
MQVQKPRQVIGKEAIDRAVEALCDVTVAEGLAHHRAALRCGHRVVVSV